MNQVQAIKNYLLAGNTLTSMEAYEMFGCTRLAAKIFMLKKEGFDIVKVMRESKTRYGATAHYAAYKLNK